MIREAMKYENFKYRTTISVNSAGALTKLYSSFGFTPLNLEFAGEIVTPVFVVQRRQLRFVIGYSENSSQYGLFSKP